MSKKKFPLSEKLKKTYNSILAETFDNDKIFVTYNKKKQPVDSVSGRLISIKNSKNLLYFKNALIGLKNSPKINGIGIVLGNTSKGNLCGLDIDNCIDENGRICNATKSIINYLDSYTEISPSGNGIHILFFAQKPGYRCKNYYPWCKGIEIYDKDRYFTLTGNTINSKSPQPRQKQCERIYKKYFSQEKFIKDFKKVPRSQDIYTSKDVEKIIIFALGKDPVLYKYWCGIRGAQSESEQDFAFMGKLLYWLQDVGLAIELFLTSPFAQSKDSYHKAKMNRNEYLYKTALNVMRKNGWRFSNGKL